MATAPTQRPFSWRRGAVHAFAPVGVAAGVGVITVAAASVPAGAVDCATSAKAVVAMVLLGLATSYFVQVRRTAWASVAGTLVGLVAVAAIATPLLARSRSWEVPLTRADRAPLGVVDVGGVTMLRHPTLGFAFERPTRTFARSRAPEWQPDMATEPSVQMWAFSSTDSLSPRAVVVVHRRSTVTRADLRRFVAGVRDGVLARMTAGTPIVRTDDIVWEPAFKGSDLRAVVGGDVTVRFATRVLAGDQYVVGLLAVGTDDRALARLVASFGR